MQSRFALVITIIIWSSSPLLVTKFSNFASPYHAAAFTIWIATLAALFFSLFNISVLIEIQRFLSSYKKNELLRLALFSSCAFVIYPVCYFYGLQKGDPLAANLINYTWPILGIIIGLKLSKSTISAEAILGAILGFCGAGIALHSALTYAPIVQNVSLWDTDYNISGTLPYFIAAAGACFYAIYSGASGLYKSSNLKNAKSQFVLMLLIASLIQLCIFIILYLLGFRSSISLDDYHVLYFLIYSVGFAVAHFSWFYVIQNMSGERHFIAVYLIPITSTLMLALAQPVPLFPILIIIAPALLFVLVGISLSQHSERPVTPLLATILMVCISLSVTKIFINTPQDIDLTMVTMEVNVTQLLLALFAILGAFTLANSIRRNSRQKLEFIGFVHCIRRIESCIRRIECSHVQLKDVLESADKCLRVVIDENFSAKRQYSLSTLNEISKLEENIQKIQNKQNVEMLLSLCSELKIKRNTLEYFRMFGVSKFEWFILILLATVMIALAFSIQADGMIFLFMRTTMVGTLVLVLFAIRDFNNGQPNKLRDFITQTQLTGGTKACLVKPYVSRYALLVSKAGNRRIAKMTIRTLDDYGKLCSGQAEKWRAADPSTSIMWLISIASAMVLYLIIG